MEETFVENCVVRVKQQNQDHQNHAVGSSHLNDGGIKQNSAEKLTEYSCSGILLHPAKGLVLTSGVAFAEFVKQRPRIFSKFSTKSHHHQQQHKKWFHQLGGGGATPRNTRYLTPKDLDALSVEVGVVKGNRHSRESTLRRDATTETTTTMENNNFTVFDAELIVLWKCQDFDNELQRLFPAKDGWQFTEDAPGPDGKLQQDSRKTTRVWDDDRDAQFLEPVGMSSASKQEVEENFVSWMALLKVKRPGGDRHFHNVR